MPEIGITREEALSLLKENLKNENLVRHCLASEAIMRALARRFGADEDLWGVTGGRGYAMHYRHSYVNRFLWANRG